MVAGMTLSVSMHNYILVALETQSSRLTQYYRNGGITNEVVEYWDELFNTMNLFANVDTFTPIVIVRVIFVF
jgi:hypothetical protein